MICFTVLSLALTFGCAGNIVAAAELVSNNRDFVKNKELGDQLIGAAIGNDVSKVKELIMKNASVNHIGVSGFSCLMIAASEGFCDIVKELLNAKAVVDLRKNKKCWPALFLAISTKTIESFRGPHLEIIQLLMEAGADVNCIVDGEQLNALDLARSNFVSAVPVIEKELEERTRADALIQDSELLHPHLVPDLVRLVSDYMAAKPIALGRGVIRKQPADREDGAVDPDGRRIKRRWIICGDAVYNIR